MLVKLLKHELKDRVKNLSAFYIVSIVFAILTRLFFMIENSLVFDVIAKFCSGVTISMMFNIIINNVLRFWVRFRQTMYGDESYLTHTLPVEKNTLYASKMISALITMLISVFVIALSVFIAYYSKQNIEALKFILGSVEATLDIPVANIIITLAIVLFLQYSCIMQNGFTGIILGHKMLNAKIGFSFLFGFIVYSVIQTISLAAVFVTGLCDKNIMNMFLTNETPSLSSLKTIMITISIMYALFVVIGYIVNVKLLKKGVNVD